MYLQFDFIQSKRTCYSFLTSVMYFVTTSQRAQTTPSLPNPALQTKSKHGDDACIITREIKIIGSSNVQELSTTLKQQEKGQTINAENEDGVTWANQMLPNSNPKLKTVVVNH